MKCLTWRLLTVASLALGYLACAASPALAGFLFDPDGDGSGGAFEVGSFDLLAGNAYSEGAGQSINWTLYYQASLGSLVNTSGNVISGTGLNAAYEITAVAAISARTVAFDDSSILFELDPSGPVNFIRMYQDTNINANPLAGTGYNDGQLILDATANADLVGTFIFPNFLLQPLDSFGANNWPGVLTRVGVGAFSASASVNAANSAYFILEPNQFLSSMFVNTSEVAPYRETNPSRQFWDGTSFVTTDVGPINAAGANVLTQADANASFVVSEVPEASSLAMLGAASGLLVLTRRLRNRAA